jgi:O-antigen ligase
VSLIRTQTSGAFAPFLSSSPLHARDVQLYRVCEVLSEALIYAMAVFGPWAFGTTQSWSIWVMNGAGYFLGAMLAAKLAIRWLKGYHPSRWDDAGLEPSGDSRLLTSSRLTAGLAWLTVAISAYCLVSAVNVYSTFYPEALRWDYRKDYLNWLPHSFDGARTWQAFWTCLGLALSFWAIRDWLLGKVEAEERRQRRAPPPGGDDSAPLLPARLRRLLWVLALNGTLLAVEGIAQRLQGGGKLLFLITPRVNPGGETQFGPYAYRANASQYFNLLWPVCLGFWWMLNRSVGSRRKARHLILVGCGVMAACPIISTSRAGALITVGIVVLAAVFLSATHFLLGAQQPQDRRTRRITLACLFLCLAGALALGFALGWKSLKPRMAQLSEGFEGREAMYEAARPMAEDYPWFGTGPGTFETVFQLYRKQTDTYWPAQLHNDWLETRITFGGLGSALIALAFVAVVLRWFAPGGIHGGRRFVILIWLGLAGCLVHARFDFPFQVHSIVFLFLVLCAILFVLTRRSGRAAG